LEFWESIKNGRSAAEFQAYLERYPNGEFAQLAANRMKLLQGAAPVPAGQHTAAAATTPTAKQPAAAVPAGTAPAAAIRPAPVNNRSKCQAILERVQLGDSLNDQDRTYIKENCS